MSLNVDQLGKPLRVKERIQETAEAVSLTLEIPEALRTQFHYQAGQFVTFFLDIKGEQLARSYSLSSSPLVDKEFKITVKKVPGGRGSNFLCDQVKVGDSLLTTPPAGLFFKPALNPQGTHYLLFAAGSGITPVYSIMKTVLTASPLNRVTLLYGNRKEDSIIYKNELEEWQRKFPAQLVVTHVLSKPGPEWKGPSGRVERGLIAQVLRTPVLAAREYYICGPVDFMRVVREALIENGVAKQFIKEENFGVAVHKPGPAVKDHWTFIGPAQGSEAPEKITALLNGETLEVAAVAGKSILETLLESGAQPPYSCMDGACMACLGKVLEGRVYQEDPGILTEDNVANCETLTCQAKPLSKIVKISYDNL